MAGSGAASRTIGLVIGASRFPYGTHAILEGIGRYGREHGVWEYRHLDEGAGPSEIRALDGIVSLVQPSPKWVERLRRQLPVLGPMGSLSNAGRGWYGYDDAGIGRLAAAHLLDHGIRRFGYVGLANLYPSRLRERGFASRVAEAGFEARVYQHEPTEESPDIRDVRQVDAVRLWLADLGRPAGVLAFNDTMALGVVEIALDAGLNVPHDVAVVGVDDNPISSQFGRMPISSVDRDEVELGYQVAARLDAMIDGRDVGAGPLLQPPARVIPRASTDVRVADPLVAQALSYIEQEACDGLTIEALLDHCATSRSNLERRFRLALGRSPHHEIRRVRLATAYRLLTETRLSLADVAARTGYQTSSYLCKAFRAEYGMSPAKYRDSRSGA